MPGPKILKMNGRASRPLNQDPSVIADYALPMLLHVNAESRQVGLETYKLLFLENGKTRNVYVDFARDTLFIWSMGSLLRLFDSRNSLTGDHYIQENLQHLMFGDLGTCYEGSRGAYYI